CLDRLGFDARRRSRELALRSLGRARVRVVGEPHDLSAKDELETERILVALARRRLETDVAACGMAVHADGAPRPPRDLRVSADAFERASAERRLPVGGGRFATIVVHV